MINYVYFGSSRLSVLVLDELLKLGQKPALIVTTPDKPQGRKLEIKPNVVKEWAVANAIPVISPAKLDASFIEDIKKYPTDLFVVASYGKIMPNDVIELPAHKTLNIHPSLLPEYRGASPLPTSILNDTKKTGVSIMQLDAEMDHGPIVAQKAIDVSKQTSFEPHGEWPTYLDFEEMMAREGARLLVEMLPKWVNGEIEAVEQDHSKATYTKKLDKSEADLKLTPTELSELTNANAAKIPRDRAYKIFRTIQAFQGWMNAYFFIDRAGAQIRVKVTDASFENGKLSIKKVIPEGKKEMTFADFVLGYIK
jgi:methionyl-tRNA formyltransferase